MTTDNMTPKETPELVVLSPESETMPPLTFGKLLATQQTTGHAKATPERDQHIGNLAGHVASALGTLKGYGHEGAAAASLQHVLDALMVMYENPTIKSDDTLAKLNDAIECVRALREALLTCNERDTPGSYEHATEQSFDTSVVGSALTLVNLFLEGNGA